MQQVDHVLRLEQAQLLFVAQLLRERQLGLLPRAAHRRDAERHGERVALHRGVLVGLQPKRAQVGLPRHHRHRGVAHLGLLAARADERRLVEADELRGPESERQRHLGLRSEHG